MKIGNRIAYFRTAKGYSVNKLATLSGISQSYLRDVELDNKNPTVEILSIVCNTLGVSLKEFFDDQTKDTLLADPLLSKIYQLTPVQRKALSYFLETMQKPDWQTSIVIRKNLREIGRAHV